MPPAQDHEGVHDAAANARVDVLRILALEHGTQALLEPNEHGHSPAFLAAAGGHGKCLRLIHEVCGPGAIRGLAEGGLSAAHLAALRGHPDCLTVLGEIDRGILSEATQNGCTPCYFACVAGRASCVQRLYELGERQSLFARDAAGKTPMDAAREAGKAPVVELLMELKRLSGNQHSPPIASSVYIKDDGAGVAGARVSADVVSPLSQGEKTPKKFMGAAASFMRKSLTKETGVNPLHFSPKDDKPKSTTFSTRGQGRKV